MMGLIYLLITIYRKYVRPNEPIFYQMRLGQQTEWVTPDEWMKRNKEHYFYLNQIGETKNESIERYFKRTN